MVLSRSRRKEARDISSFAFIDQYWFGVASLRIPALASTLPKDYNSVDADLSHGSHHLTEECCRC